MNYRVEVADRADGLYAVRDGQVCHAQRSTTDGTVLLTALPAETPPTDFDTEREGVPAKVVAESEVATTFRLHTLARYDDEYYRISDRHDGSALTLRWTGRDENVATQLGLDNGSVTVNDVESLTALWQERRDRPGPPHASGTDGEDTNELLRSIGLTLRDTLPQGWQRAAAQFRQIGDYAELEVRAAGTDATGTMVVAVPAPVQLSELFTRLRAAMYEPGAGTWLQGTFTLDSESRFDFDFDRDTEPAWRLDPAERETARTHDVELEYYPRERTNTPGWLAAKAGLPAELSFRHARVVDSHAEGHTPVVNREPVTAEEAHALLGYLYRAPVVASRQGLRPDIFAPHAAPDVPDAFHTDGSWIWPAAVPHYLRKYGLPPEDELLAHIRATQHRPPYVERVVRAAAQAELDGGPAPRATNPDVLPAHPTRIDRGQEPADDMLASQVLEVLRRRVTEHGIATTSYEIGAARDDAWCLRRTDSGWEVAYHAAGVPVEPQYFTAVEPAARALLGTLLLYPIRAEPDDAAEADLQRPQRPEDWPIGPARGEPPLSLLQHKRMITLPVGKVLHRFGNLSGNLVHPQYTEFVETSLPPDREQEQQTLVVQRPLYVLTGVSTAWSGMRGGAVAYLLPQQVGQHLESGALQRRTATGSR